MYSACRAQTRRACRRRFRLYPASSPSKPTPSRPSPLAHDNSRSRPLSKRTPKRAFIGLFLAIQIAVPLSYYLGDDKLDERFAWRMFSTVRMARCIDLDSRSQLPAFFVDSRPIPLYRHFHEAWVSLAKRGRKSVIAEMAQHLCEQYPGSEVRVRYSCFGHGKQILGSSGGGANLCGGP